MNVNRFTNSFNKVEGRAKAIQNDISVIIYSQKLGLEVVKNDDVNAQDMTPHEFCCANVRVSKSGCVMMNVYINPLRVSCARITRSLISKWQLSAN